MGSRIDLMGKERQASVLLEAAGFASVEAFAGLSDQPYGLGSLRLAAVARKTR